MLVIGGSLATGVDGGAGTVCGSAGECVQAICACEAACRRRGTDYRGEGSRCGCGRADHLRGVHLSGPRPVARS